MPVPSKRSKQKAAPSSAGRPDTPPDSPTWPFDVTEFAKQFFDTVKLITAPESKDSFPSAEPQVEGNAVSVGPKARASKVEVKEVHEVWDSKTYRYKIVESIPTPEVTELDVYVFVVRVRIGKTTSKPTIYVDIKSEGLRDILRVVLKDIKWITLGEDKPAVERNLLYNYLSELEACRVDAADNVHDRKTLEALDLLIQTIKNSYKSITERLTPLLAEGKITYDLLWTLFKANDHVVTICRGSRKPRCVRYDFGEEKKTSQGVKYFELQCRSFDFDGNVFGEVVEKLAIEKFHGAKRIDSLEAFPLVYHPTPEDLKKHLLQRGRKFREMRDSHHVCFEGNAFFQEPNGLVRRPVKSRIMIDAGLFRKSNPSYSRLFTKKSGGVDVGQWCYPSTEQSDSERVKSNGIEPGKMKDDDLLICPATALGFSLADKFWGEYAVEDIRDIDWSALPFNSLTIPAQKKEVIMAVTRSRMDQTASATFDDVIEGKGRSLNILLQGPPGVGKTLTAEAISEHFKRPLYSISAGELSSDAAELEGQLSHIFQTASTWKALLLMDEAGVFLGKRSDLTLERNRLVAVFLRKLEYFDGVLFLTTNLVGHLDEAILNRIHLALTYESLDRNARRTILAQFLKMTGTDRDQPNLSAEEVERLAQIQLNGRQIKNTVAIANALVTVKDTLLSFSHLCQALTANGYSIPDLDDTPVDYSLYDS